MWVDNVVIGLFLHSKISEPTLKQNSESYWANITRQVANVEANKRSM